ncbi:hypothetical protein BY458DRAFT_431524 [Sporodiniella umbellata]|nr:hypothetical protein BY458DRAFT_431524 [Sporodiniella umbellata]
MGSFNEKQVEQLLQLFPKGDPEYFQSCLEHYHEDAVERVAEKIAESGYYPQLPEYDPIKDNRMNVCLRILALDIFPDCDVGFLREKVLEYSYAHLDQVANAMLQLQQWPERLNYGQMESFQEIQSQSYKDQAHGQLVQDFPQIWRSSIQAVLAENNWDYIQSYDQLQAMGSGGFWKSLRNLFLHWHSSHTKHSTGRDVRLCEQMEVIERRAWDSQMEGDHQLAEELNEKEYDQMGQSITCGCCYSDFAFESILFCSEAQHAFCHECVRHYLSEGLFGQGSLRGQPRIDCISSDPCEGCLPMRSLESVLSNDLVKAYEQSQLESFASNEERIQCCACAYFELDDASRPEFLNPPWLRSISRWLMVVEFALLCFFSYSLLSIVISLPWLFFLQWDVLSDLSTAYERLIQNRRGSVLKCKNPECKTDTCLQCQRPFRGLHTCWEKETDGLRLYVEKAMADAVKRTVSALYPNTDRLK